MVWLAWIGASFASDAVTPSVVVHHGREISVFDADRVEVTTDPSAHRLTTPLGHLDLPVPVPGTLAVTGQTWLLNDHVWVEVLRADSTLVEFAIVELD